MPRAVGLSAYAVPKLAAQATAAAAAVNVFMNSPLWMKTAERRI
jgi:hypothetical protein